MNNILIYSPKITTRLKYTFRLVFKDLFQIDCEFTDGLGQFEVGPSWLMPKNMLRKVYTLIRLGYFTKEVSKL